MSATSAPRGSSGSRSKTDAFAGPTAKFFSAEIQARTRASASTPSRATCSSSSPIPQAVTSQALSNLRQRLGDDLKLFDPASFHYSWVVRFPLLAWDDEENRWVAEHHPFTQPVPEDLHLLDTDPAKVRAQAYDLVINGEEAGGGTIRVHDSAIQSKIFSLLGLSPEAGPGKVWLPSERPQVRRTAARRHRAGASTAWS